MTKQYTPSQLMAFCIKYAMQVHGEGEGMFMRHKDPSDFMNMVSWNFDNSQTERDAWTFQPLTEPSLESIVKREIEDQARFGEKLDQILTASGLVGEVDRLLNEELTKLRFRIPPFNATPGILRKKALKVVALRTQREAAVTATKDDHFLCYLTTFSDGRAEFAKRMLLYFDYSLPFGDFMAQLTDKTRNCTIPPQGVKPRDQQQNNKDFNSHQPVFRVRTNIEKGYSLLDGPWIYRVSPIKLDGQFGTRKPLATAHQYEQMKVDIKDAEKAIKKEGLEGKLRQYIVVIHSLDRVAEESWKKQEDARLEAEEVMESEFRASYKAKRIYDLSQAHERDYGVPYMEWLKSDFRKNQQQVATNLPTNRELEEHQLPADMSQHLSSSALENISSRKGHDIEDAEISLADITKTLPSQGKPSTDSMSKGSSQNSNDINA